MLLMPGVFVPAMPVVVLVCQRVHPTREFNDKIKEYFYPDNEDYKIKVRYRAPPAAVFGTTHSKSTCSISPPLNAADAQTDKTMTSHIAVDVCVPFVCFWFSFLILQANADFEVCATALFYGLRRWSLQPGRVNPTSCKGRMRHRQSHACTMMIAWSRWRILPCLVAIRPRL